MSGSAVPPSFGPGDVQRELHELARRHERRRHLLPRALLVGLLAGLVAVLFRLTLDRLDALRDALFVVSHRLPWWGVAVPVLLCSLTAGMAVWLVRRWAPETAGSGIPHLEAVLHRLVSLRWARVLVVKFTGGCLALGSGLALGARGRRCRWEAPSAKWSAGGCAPPPASARR